MITAVWSKFKEHQAAKFIFVGFLNTVVGYVAFAFFIYIELRYALALFLATIIGVLHSYCWNKYFTFVSKQRSFKEFVRFVSVYVCIYFLNLVVLWLFIDKLLMNPLIAQAIALFFVTITSFVGHKFWSFKRY